MSEVIHPHVPGRYIVYGRVARFKHTFCTGNVW